MDRQSVSHRIIGPNHLTKSSLRTEQSDSDKNDVKVFSRKPEYMPSGLTFSKDVHHRNNRDDHYQSTMNNTMDMERGHMHSLAA